MYYNDFRDFQKIVFYIMFYNTVNCGEMLQNVDKKCQRKNFENWLTELSSSSSSSVNIRKQARGLYFRPK